MSRLISFLAEEHVPFHKKPDARMLHHTVGDMMHLVFGHRWQLCFQYIVVSYSSHDSSGRLIVH